MKIFHHRSIVKLATISLMMISLCAEAQQKTSNFTVIENIPLPENCRFDSDYFLKTIPQPLRQDLKDDYVFDKDKIGRFNTYAVENARCYSFVSDENRVLDKAYPFYKKLFGITEEYRCKEGYCGFDLQKLSKSNFTEVRLIPSNGGGCVFEWMCLKNDKLVKLSIAVPGWGNKFEIFEYVYAENVPLPTAPDKEELHFPLYLGAVFVPQCSKEYFPDYKKLKHLKNRIIVFKTADKAEKVAAFFADAIEKQEDDPLFFMHKFQQNSEKGNWHCLKFMGKEWSVAEELLPRLNIEFHPTQYRNNAVVEKAYTSIEYSYLSEYKTNDLNKLLEYEH